MHRHAVAGCLFSLASALQAADAADAFSVNTQCMQEAMRETEVNLNSGVYTEEAVVSVPLTLKLINDMDPEAYGECLRRAGAMIDARDDAYLRAVEYCRDRRTGSAQVRIEHGATRIEGGGRQALSACIARRLKGIEVEVLPPGPVTPPPAE